jgi:hypothetical protein
VKRKWFSIQWSVAGALVGRERNYKFEIGDLRFEIGKAEGRVFGIRNSELRIRILGAEGGNRAGAGGCGSQQSRPT